MRFRETTASRDAPIWLTRDARAGYHVIRPRPVGLDRVNPVRTVKVAAVSV